MTDDHPVAVFDRHAGEYEALRRRLVPSYDAFYGAAIGALGLAGRPLRRVLDLGGGTGLLTRAVLDAHPQAYAVLLDGSTRMLEQAERVLGDRAEFVLGDLADPLPRGPWDAIVSALAIHHLADEAKRSLFERVAVALTPGGMFVNADQVMGPTAALDGRYRAWHRSRARELGASEREWAEACERMRADRLATVEDQLAWLAGAGLSDVDCLFKDHCLAVLAGRRAVDQRRPTA